MAGEWEGCRRAGDSARFHFDMGNVAEEACAIAHEIWEHPEVSGEERFATQNLKQLLASHGFSVEAPAIDALPTSFVARYRTSAARGKRSVVPVIGLLAEYDALPGLSQDAVPYRKPLVEGGPGHGCGHCLLGAGSSGAAIAAVEALEERGLAAEVVLFGTPAEETLQGKVDLAEAGVFDGLSACFSWHPMSFTGVSRHKYAALVSARYEFEGVAGHAALDPSCARSATDAVELMAVGANYLREHIPRCTMLAYANRIDAGAPNVIADRADAWYHARGATLEDARNVANRLDDVARGAALMTGATVTIHPESTCEATLLNGTLAALLERCLEGNPAPALTPEESDFAASISRTLGDDPGRFDREVWGVKEEGLEHSPIIDEPVRYARDPVRIMGASDYSNVSVRVPTAQVWIASAPLGTPAHSWQNVACAGSSLGARAVRRAIAVLAAAVVACVERPGFIRTAQEEFSSRASAHPLPVL